MKRKRFSVEQIVGVLKQVEVGVPVAELIRQVGITEQTLYRWKKQYKGLETDQVRQCKQLQEENGRLKRLVAELTLDKVMLQDVLGKKTVTPWRRRPVVSYGHDTYRVSERRACRLARVPVSTFRYESMQEPRTALRLRIREIAQTRVRYGYRKIRVLLNREGWKVGKKLVYRLYKGEGLTLRHKPGRKRRAGMQRRERFRPTAPNQVWGLDFVADQLADGRRFRTLTVLDVFTRESLAIEVGQSLKGEDVVTALNQIRQKRGTPKLLFCDNGAEFTSQRMDLWAYHNQVQIDFSRPGKPTDNAYVESFNGTLRAECLDVHWFATLTEAKQVIEAWRREYNESVLTGREREVVFRRLFSKIPYHGKPPLCARSGDRKEDGVMANDPLLKQGDKSPDVARAQDLLNRDGAILEPDGDFGGGTEAAVREFQARSGLTVSAVVDNPTWQRLLVLPEPSRDMPSRAVAFICREEVSSREYYDAHASRPTWPGGASGVTIGVGYDLGYELGLETDWAHLLTPTQIAALNLWVGVKGTAAEAAIAKLNAITIPWYSAWLSFIGKSLPAYVNQTRQAFANSQTLPPLCFGVLVSLVYNRGASMTDSSSHPGDRNEMRDIRDAVTSGHFEAIPSLLRSMERLWPLGNGLRTRREQEAELFEAGLEM